MSLGERLMKAIKDNGGSISLFDASEALSVTTRQASTAASRLIAKGELCRDVTWARENLIYYFVPGTPGFQADR